MMRATAAILTIGTVGAMTAALPSVASQSFDVPVAAAQTLTDRLARVYSDGDTALLDSVLSSDYEYVEIDKSGTIVLMKSRSEALAYFSGFTQTLNFISASVSVDPDSWRWIPAPANRLGGSADLKCDGRFSFTASDAADTFRVSEPASFVLSRTPDQTWRIRRWSQDFTD